MKEEPGQLSTFTYDPTGHLIAIQLPTGEVFNNDKEIAAYMEQVRRQSEEREKGTGS